MQKLKSFLGYFAAALSLAVILVMLAALMAFSEPFLEITGLKTSPNYSGGEVVRTIEHQAYQTQIHRMVFDDTLIGERSEGFIQVNWTPRSALPDLISEDIDADSDGQADFRLEINPDTRETTVTAFSDWVLGWEGTYKPGDSLMTRVKIKNVFR